MRDLSPGRARILDLIADEERSVTDLATTLGREHTNVSRDLRIMYAAGLVDRRRERGVVYYRAARTGRGAR